MSERPIKHVFVPQPPSDEEKMAWSVADSHAASAKVLHEQLTALQLRVAELEAENKLLDLRVRYLVASINNSRSICHWSEPRFPHECVAIQDGDSASCRICEKDMGWFCPSNPTKCCEYSDESEYDECCIHCKLPSERK